MNSSGNVNNNNAWNANRFSPIAYIFNRNITCSVITFIKLKRLVLKAKKGDVPRSKVEEAFDCWKANAMKGNSYKLIYRMEKYYQELWRTL